LYYSVSAIEPVEEVGQAKPKQYLKKTVVPLQSPSEYQKFCILLKSYYTQLYRDWVSDMATQLQFKSINLQVILIVSKVSSLSDEINTFNIYC
jgi:hypothetical protein